MAKTTSYKEGTATVKAVYYTSKTLHDGSHPFMVRITKNRKLKYISTGLSLHPKYWNDKHTGYKEAIRKSFTEPYRQELIDKLTKWEQKFTHAEKELADADEAYDANAVAIKAVESRKKARTVSLLNYMDELVQSMVLSRQKGNSITYRDLRNQLAAFIHVEYEKTADVSMNEVNVRFCNKLEIFFRQRGNAETTLSNRFRTLRAVLNKAIAEGVSKPEHYPFARNTADKHKFSIGKFNTTTQKRAISRSDIQKIEAFIPIGTFLGPHASLRNLVEVDRLTLARAVFLFSFYCGGINFVDLAKLRWNAISTDAEGYARLNYTRQKTGSKFSIRLLPPVKEIVEKYRSTTYKTSDSYIFSILDINKHQTSAQIHNRIHKVSAMVNVDLKEIGKRTEINTPLTTYVARHSFATTLRQKGTATAVISQAMGHKSEAVTAIYLDSFSSEVVDLAYEALL